MNFTVYINSQKSRVRTEHDGEMQLIAPEGQVCTIYGCVLPVRDSEDILREIDSLPGLNAREREECARIRRAASARTQPRGMAYTVGA